MYKYLFIFLSCCYVYALYLGLAVLKKIDLIIQNTEIGGIFYCFGYLLFVLLLLFYTGLVILNSILYYKRKQDYYIIIMSIILELVFIILYHVL